MQNWIFMKKCFTSDRFYHEQNVKRIYKLVSRANFTVKQSVHVNTTGAARPYTLDYFVTTFSIGSLHRKRKYNKTIAVWNEIRLSHFYYLLGQQGPVCDFWFYDTSWRHEKPLSKKSSSEEKSHFLLFIFRQKLKVKVNALTTLTNNKSMHLDY